MFALDIKILVVDDMTMARMLVKKALNDIGFTNITEALDGKQAWELLNSTPDFQLVVSDWNMPMMTGIELLKKLRTTPQFENLPFVMLTAEGEEKQIKEAFQSGVNGYITKPFTAEVFHAKLEFAHRKIQSAA